MLSFLNYSGMVILSSIFDMLVTFWHSAIIPDVTLNSSDVLVQQPTKKTSTLTGFGFIDGETKVHIHLYRLLCIYNNYLFQ